MSDIARQGLESQEAASTAPAESSSAKQRARKGLANASYEEQQQQLTPAEVESGGPPTELKQLYQYEGFEELESKLGADPVAKPLLLDWRWALLGLGESAKAPATDAQSQSKGTASNTPAITVPPATTNAPPPPQVTGLASKVNIGRFVTAAKKVETDWGTLTKQQRAEGLGDAAGDELKAVGVPETGVVVKDMGPSRNGELDFQPWNLNLNEKRFETPTVTKDQMAGMADTVYHESRHAEQWHRMARMLAGQGKSGEEIAKQTYIRKDVCEDAAKKPLKGSGQEAKEGQEWLDSVYGAKAAHRNTVLTNLGTHGATYQTKVQDIAAKQAAYDVVNKNPTSTKAQKDAAMAAWVTAYNAYTTAKAAFETTYAQYRALPEEKDAWAVGGDVGTAYQSLK